ncbi:helix-turn-helix domain-containing protein [Pseudescherichia sp.]|uniref:helix-turn-helix domain-containing protein n=1 Tax=Pseudescherichia sp. TaxID=2055881 RepID=UPI00289B4C3B|nr:helix-turn-helix domain-containing protein [Pseudescherichia sp.]
MGKPCKQIHKVMTSFINHADISSDIHIFPSQVQETVRTIDDDILIILEGKVALYNKMNHLLLGEIYGPYILNLVPDALSQLYYISESSRFSYLKYPREAFYTHIEEQALWSDLFHILSFSSLMLMEQLEVMKFRTLYDVVKYYLLKIDGYSNLRESENVCNYIVSRTGYSKSGVMTILKELKKGGYIATYNGRLIRLKNLPLRF